MFSTTTASFSTTYVEDVSRQWRRRSRVGPDHGDASLASVRAFEFEGVRSIDPKRSHSRMFRVSTTFFEWCPCFEAESIEISDRAVFTTHSWSQAASCLSSGYGISSCKIQVAGLSSGYGISSCKIQAAGLSSGYGIASCKIQVAGLSSGYGISSCKIQVAGLSSGYGISSCKIQVAGLSSGYGISSCKIQAVGLSSGYGI